ncbi:HAD-IA family hydrolase [Lysinibacillus sp. CD3-6]|uniref:HAD-IA family hydrolase n=1 Tax=Lysinibacillus sp. CD3-6 TaxID=2892541 RepID=UPI0011731642|nr:HAD-IA family hydrolase [Lysinibacillus sp. CD3-6]UED81863.1 HAD-IA family hydrolase [Lysinibacillus sp. CD3-6]
MKHIIFDFDGTLADSTAVLASVWNTIAKEYDFKEVQLEDIDSLKKISITERSKLFNFPLHKLPIILPQFYHLYQQSIKDVHLFRGMKDVLKAIENKGYTIAIISSNSKDNISEFLKVNDINHVSEVLCSSRIFGKDKVIKKYIKETNIKKSDVLYVGDEQRDIVACKKVGIPIIWVGWGYDAIEVVQSEKPDYKVFSPAEILTII